MSLARQGFGAASSNVPPPTFPPIGSLASFTRAQKQPQPHPATTAAVATATTTTATTTTTTTTATTAATATSTAAPVALPSTDTIKGATAISGDPPICVTKEFLARYFHMPISQAAKELGVCTTMLKKMCRKSGVARWPFRKIHSLDRMIASLDRALKANPPDAVAVARELAALRVCPFFPPRPPHIFFGSPFFPPAHEALDGTHAVLSLPPHHYRRDEN